MTFTKEQLQNLIEFNSSDSDGQANAESWEVHKLAEMALAGMETEPVACIDQANLDYLKSGSDADVWPVSSSDDDSVLLYSAPQPATVVIGANGLLPCPFCGGEPEEDAGGCSEYSGHEHQDYSISCNGCGAEVYCSVGSFEKADVPCSCHHDTRTVCVNKWNRRAAMLQGKADGNSSVIPEGWVTVPVEPTAEMMAEAKRWTGLTSTAEIVYREMIAAAPRQEAE